ncbi:ABC transporter ATP-binding protein [Streptomyces sp. Da 82-17]|uniref:ABC transporter ATP-binding protein n=1 Tax=Streptomyces sp. Da 82-17 TaxID=3377116 RepID=UPI0038D41154
MATVSYEKATRRYPDADRPAVDALSLDIADGEFLVLVGPSGCGKSTSLRMLAGLEDVSDGVIRIGERDVTHLPPKDRDIAMVFQNYALYPHMSVGDNMGFALKVAGTSKDEIRRRVREAARILDLEPFLERKPKALSGGQRQRVAMGRAIVREPRVFLMDEPLSNLDAKLRTQTRTEIAALQRRLATTTVYVTHDQVEAMTMGDRVAVLKNGLLQQCAAPRTLYEEPDNVFVASFIGSPTMNLTTVRIEDDGVRIGGAHLPLSRRVLAAAAHEDSDSIVFGFRPEALEQVGADERALSMSVAMVEELGAEAYAYGTLDGTGTGTGTGTNTRGSALAPAGLGTGSEGQIIARVDPRNAPAKGERISLRIRPGGGYFFSARTGRRIATD